MSVYTLSTVSGQRVVPGRGKSCLKWMEVLCAVDQFLTTDGSWLQRTALSTYFYNLFTTCKFRKDRSRGCWHTGNLCNRKVNIKNIGKTYSPPTAFLKPGGVSDHVLQYGYHALCSLYTFVAYLHIWYTFILSSHHFLAFRHIGPTVYYFFRFSIAWKPNTMHTSREAQGFEL